MKVAIIKYNAGNTQSVSFALERLGVQCIVTDNADQIKQSDKVIFPGVGEASKTMEYLKSKKLDEVIRELTQPVLGICLGMQLLCSYSEENETAGLGIFNEIARKFIPVAEERIPHMGWNQLQNTSNWLRGFDNETMYFVHSYYVPVNDYTTAVTEHGIPFSSAIRKNNFYGVQFHPEKSAKAGEQILKNFLTL